MLHLTLKHSDGDRELTLSTKDLSEMIEELKTWQDFEFNMEMVRKTKRYIANPEKEEKAEKESGWYWHD